MGMGMDGTLFILLLGCLPATINLSRPPDSQTNTNVLVPEITAPTPPYAEGKLVTLICKVLTTFTLNSVQTPLTWSRVSGMPANVDEVPSVSNLGIFTEYSSRLSFQSTSSDNRRALTCSANVGIYTGAASFEPEMILRPNIPVIDGPDVIRYPEVASWTCQSTGASYVPPNVYFRNGQGIHLYDSVTQQSNISTDVYSNLMYTVNVNLTSSLPTTSAQYRLVCWVTHEDTNSGYSYTITAEKLIYVFFPPLVTKGSQVGDLLQTTTEMSQDIQCEIPSSNPLATSVTWTLNGTVINTNNGRYTGGSISLPSLRITSVQRTDLGDYVCSASNTEGTGTFTTPTTLDVRYQPTFTYTSGTTFNVTLGGSAFLECPIEANPAPTTIRWWRQSSGIQTFIDIDNDARYSGGTTVNQNYGLTINPLEISDGDSFYYCQAINAVSSATGPLLTMVVNNCDSGHYGKNCEHDCNCVDANTAECSRFSGRCICKKEWTGYDCSDDIDECQSSQTCPGNHEFCNNLNGSYACVCDAGYSRSDANAVCEDINECKTTNKCTTNELCSNSEGSYTCFCDVGYSRPDPTSSCKGCDATHFGQDCSHTCSCAEASTADCDDKDGYCTCKYGWTGRHCDVDVDECQSINFCTGVSNEFCSNLPGNYTCLCDVGFHRPMISSLCQACNATTYGQDCASTCSCAVANTADCNDKSGVCVCKHGWTGINCATDVDECRTTNNCTGNNELCYNLPGSYNCLCDVGFSRADPTATCKACNATTYGQDCVHACSCIHGNSIDCNDRTGACTCKHGWTGTTCGTDIDECLTQNNCTWLSNEFCSNLDGGYTCLCYNGFSRPNSSSQCQGCDRDKYGHDCSQTCTCIQANTADCNNQDGTCTCTTGWKGTDCDTDVNECTVANNCTGNNESCYNYEGSYACLCDVGFSRTDYSSPCRASANTDVFIEATPSVIDAGLTKNLTINCTYNHRTGSEFTALMSLILSKANLLDASNFSQIATIDIYSGGVVHVTNTTIGANVTGHLDGRGVSNIMVQWSGSPLQTNIAGTYKCEAFGMGNNWHPQSAAAVASVIETA